MAHLPMELDLRCGPTSRGRLVPRCGVAATIGEGGPVTGLRLRWNDDSVAVVASSAVMAGRRVGIEGSQLAVALSSALVPSRLFFGLMLLCRRLTNKR